MESRITGRLDACADRLKARIDDLSKTMGEANRGLADRRSSGGSKPPGR